MYLTDQAEHLVFDLSNALHPEILLLEHNVVR